MTTQRIGIEVGKSYTWTRGNEQTIVTALASPWAEQRIAELEDALRRVVRDVNDYEEANKLSPNPGRSECWDSVAHAKAVLAGA